MLMKRSILVLLCAALPACALADSCQPAQYAPAATDDMSASDMNARVDAGRDMRVPPADMSTDMALDMSGRDMPSDMSAQGDMGQQPTLPMLNANARFGTSLALSAHGDDLDLVWVAAGAPARDYPSAFNELPGQVILSLIPRASLRERAGELERGVIIAPEGDDSQPGDSFGQSVALSQQGTFLAVGAPGYSEGAGLETGAVFIFERQ